MSSDTVISLTLFLQPEEERKEEQEGEEEEKEEEEEEETPGEGGEEVSCYTNTSFKQNKKIVVRRMIIED